MEKKLFQAFLITILFLIFWSYIAPKKQPQPPPPQEVVQKEFVGEIKEKQTPTDLIVTPEEEKQIDLPQATIGNFIVTYSPSGGYIKEISIVGDENGLPFKNIGYIPQDQDKEFISLVEANKIVFTGPGGEEKEFVFGADTVEINLSPFPARPIILFSNYLAPSMLNQRYQEVFYSQDGIIKRKGGKKVKPADYKGVNFAGARDRYYCISLLKGTYDIKWTKENSTSHLYLLSPPSKIALYLGPQKQQNLKPYGLGGIIYYGFFHIIAIGMTKVLYLLFALTKNWGLAIIAFSVLIYFILFPFTAKSTKAMKRMQEIQPEVEALKEKHKDNPQKMQKETMEIYRKYKINPLGGCLPLFFQLPVFMALYQVLFRLVDLKEAHFLWIKNLTLPDRLFALPFTIPVVNVKYFNLLPLLVMILGLIQQKIMTSSTAPSQQKSMGLFMSVFIGIIFYNFPSALVLYWFTQNLLTLSYQSRLARTRAETT